MFLASIKRLVAFSYHVVADVSRILPENVSTKYMWTCHSCVKDSWHCGRFCRSLQFFTHLAAELQHKSEASVTKTPLISQ